MGGSLPDDDEIAKINLKLKNEEEKSKLDFHNPVEAVDEDLNESEMDLPDRKLTMMGDL